VPAEVIENAIVVRDPGVKRGIRIAAEAEVLMTVG